MSIYTEATLGETDNQVTFNDFSGASDPVFRVLARAPQKFQIRQQDLPVPFESGDNDFLTLLGEVVYILSGKMYPSSESAYDAGLAALRSVSSLDLNQADVSSVNGYVPYVWGDFSNQKVLFLKPLYCQLAETTAQGFVQPFTIYCKVIDPTIYVNSLQTASTSASSPSTTTGSADYPFTYPVVYGSTLFTVTATALNIGTIPVYPVTIIVKGPVTNPVVTNSATGEYIEVDVTLNSTSDQLNISYNETTLDINLNGTNVINKLTSGSTLFKIHPGSQTITLSGNSVGIGALAQVQYRSGYPLA